MAASIVITGANGWIGGHVGDTLAEAGWSVTGVSRSPDSARRRRPDRRWIGTGVEFAEAVEHADVVLNLAGRHVFEQPWNQQYVTAMRESRIATTCRVAAALVRSDRPGRSLVSGSGYPVYGDTGEQVLTEESPTSQELIAGAMDRDWEDATQEAGQRGVRVVLLRLGLVFGADGGAFPVLRKPFDEGSGVVLGDGRQWVPWVHLQDAVRLIIAALHDPAYSGPLNVVAPQPARHEDVARAIAQALGVPCQTHVPAADVQAMLGGVSELLLASQKMTPAKALAHGFGFAHPEIGEAVKDLVTQRS